MLVYSFFFLLSENQLLYFVFFFSSRRRHTSWNCDWSSDVCSSDLRALRRAHRDRRVEPLQGGGRVHRLERARDRHPPPREEVLSSRAIADRRRGLPARPRRGRLPGPRRLRPGWLEGDGEAPGESARQLDLDRRR